MLKTLFLLALCPCGPGCDCGPACGCVGPPALARQDVQQAPPADLPPPAWVLDRVQKMEARQAAVEFDLAALKADVRVVKQDAADAKRAAADTAAGIGRIEALLAERKAAAAAPPPAPAPAPANRYLVNGHWYVDHPTKPGWVTLETPEVVGKAPFAAGTTTTTTSAPSAGGTSPRSPGGPGAGGTYTLAPAGAGGCTSGGCAGGSCGVPQRAGLFFRRR